MYFSSYHERVQNFPFFAQYLLLRRLQHRLWVVPHLQSEVFPYFNTSSKEKRSCIAWFCWIGLRIFLYISDHIMLTKHKCYRRHQYLEGGGESCIKASSARTWPRIYANIPDLTPILTKNKWIKSLTVALQNDGGCRSLVQCLSQSNPS